MKDNNEMNIIIEQKIKERMAGILSMPIKEVESAIDSKRRMRELATIKHSYRYLLRKHTDLSLKAIGRRSAMVDHTSVLHSIKEVENMLSISATNRYNSYYKALDKIKLEELL